MAKSANISGAPARPIRLGHLASYLLNRIGHRYNQKLQSQLKAVGMTPITLRTIVSLHAYGALTVNELCVHAIAEQPTMSRTLDKMGADGLILREVSPEDQRVRVVRLTDAGRAAYRDIWPVMADANEELLESLSAEDRDALMRILNTILQSIRQNPF